MKGRFCSVVKQKQTLASSVCRTARGLLFVLVLCPEETPFSVNSTEVEFCSILSFPEWGQVFQSWTVGSFFPLQDKEVHLDTSFFLLVV